MTYGAQGNPINVPREPVPPPPTVAYDDGCVAEHSPATNRACVMRPAAPVAVDTAIVTEPGLVKPTPHDASNTTDATEPVEQRLAKAEATIAAQRAILDRAAALVPGWDTKAATIPQKGDYQKGARLATVQCSDDLRAVLGI